MGENKALGLMNADRPYSVIEDAAMLALLRCKEGCQVNPIFSESHGKGFDTQ